MPNKVAPVKMIKKMTAPNENNIVSDIYLFLCPASMKAPRARIDGTQTPT
jgi:hypothetical protein